MNIHKVACSHAFTPAAAAVPGGLVAAVWGVLAVLGAVVAGSAGSGGVSLRTERE